MFRFQGKEYVSGNGRPGLWESWAWHSQYRGWDSLGRAGLGAGDGQRRVQPSPGGGKPHLEHY